jgi:hypothetical protein
MNVNFLFILKEIFSSIFAILPIGLAHEQCIKRIDVSTNGIDGATLHSAGAQEVQHRSARCNMSD